MNNGCNYILRGIDAEGGSVKFVLSAPSLVVGRQGDVLLGHESVSRRHALLECRDGDWIVTDLDSRNGTFVNRAAVRRHVLVVGDVIRFGSVALRFEASESGNRADAATATMRPEELAAARDRLAFGSLVGRSEALRRAMDQAVRAARSGSTVLLLGETGTGKELFARFIRDESARRKEKFIAVNCGAIAATLQESTLFGHEKGAFTGADRRRNGLFEEAGGGTLFLDEVGELTTEMQVKLLRVIQEGELMRVGGVETIRTDVRLVCATNRDLAQMVREGRFRQDLYYRLNVIQIRLPPLRERREDIPDLVNHFAAQLGGEAAKTFSPEALAALAAYDWPGNVRELANVVERAAVMVAGQEVELADLPDEVRTGGRPPVSEDLGDVALSHILAVLAEAGGNKTRAAERLGISRSTLHEKLRRAGMAPDSTVKHSNEKGKNESE